eukprot:scaffold13983_cov125-Isochrysis_galbana.AAC.16
MLRNNLDSAGLKSSFFLLFAFCGRRAAAVAPPTLRTCALSASAQLRNYCCSTSHVAAVSTLRCKAPPHPHRPAAMCGGGPTAPPACVTPRTVRTVAVGRSTLHSARCVAAAALLGAGVGRTLQKANEFRAGRAKERPSP